MTAIAYAIQLLQLLVTAIPQGQALYNDFQTQIENLKAMQADGNRDPSPEEWASLNALIDAQRAILHAE